jgi:hypothetical protein
MITFCDGYTINLYRSLHLTARIIPEGDILILPLTLAL